MAKRGRKADYDPARHPRLAEALARNGHTDVEIANFLGITKKTVNEWKNKHPEFGSSIKRGKEETDFEVENALLKRALGYEYDETETTMAKVVEDGKEILKPGKIRRVRKAVPPDTTACIFWLKNRQRDRWRDVQGREHSGPGGGPVEIVDETAREIAAMTPEERRAKIDALIAKRGT